MSVTGNKQDLVYVGPQDQQLPAADILVVVDGDTTPTRLGTALTGGGGDVPSAGPLTGDEVIRFTQDGDEVEGTTQDIADLGGGGDFEEITSGASPVVANPDVAFSIVTTSGTAIGTENITLANPTDPSKPAFKTFTFKFVNTGDFPTLVIGSSVGFTNPLVVVRDQVDGTSAIAQLVWDPSLLAWQAVVGGGVYTNGNGIETLGGDIDLESGSLLGANVSASTVQVSGGQGPKLSDEGTAQLRSFTVAGLPGATAWQGALVFVTDASATTRLSIVSGGGANKVICVSDATNWLIV